MLWWSPMLYSCVLLACERYVGTCGVNSSMYAIGYGHTIEQRVEIIYLFYHNQFKVDKTVPMPAHLLHL